ncbi:MAG: hypothetical protein KAR11_02505 [Phycisphaerae bacterium]|nr:hypothetical protein [Phycisphaerae bacterium]
MRLLNVLLFSVLLGVVFTSVGCSSRPTKPVEDPADSSVGAEVCIYEDEEFFEIDERERKTSTATVAAPVPASETQTPATPKRPAPAGAVASVSKAKPLPAVSSKKPPATKVNPTPAAKPTPPVDVAVTDKDAIKTVMNTLVEAITSNDKATFMQNVVATSKTKPNIESMFDAIVTLQQFTDAMTEAYGDNAMKSLPIPVKLPTLNEQMINTAKIKILRNKKSAVVPIKKNQRLNLIKKAGAWKWDILKMSPQMRKPMYVAMMKKATAAIKKTMPKIGQDGYTAKKINNELMRSVMPGGMPAGMPRGMPR